MAVLGYRTAPVHVAQKQAETRQCAVNSGHFCYHTAQQGAGDTGTIGRTGLHYHRCHHAVAVDLHLTIAARHRAGSSPAQRFAR